MMTASLINVYIYWTLTQSRLQTDWQYAEEVVLVPAFC